MQGRKDTRCNEKNITSEYCSAGREKKNGRLSFTFGARCMYLPLIIHITVKKLFLSVTYIFLGINLLNFYPISFCINIWNESLIMKKIFLQKIGFGTYK